MATRSSRAFFLQTLLLGFAGCSAIVNPDTGELGGADLSGDSGGGATAGSDANGGSNGVEMCEAGCAADERCSPVLGCVPLACRANIDCSDADPCTGIETCSPGAAGADPVTGCVAGMPKNCDDGITCTVDGCDPASDCTHAPNNTFCDDAIGCTNDVCNANATPGTDGCVRTPDDSKCRFCYRDGVCSPQAGGCAGSVPTNCSDGDGCTSDSCDDELMMCVSVPRDSDGDGAVLDSCGGDDCNDGDAAIHPGATEICDGEDDNCDGDVDEGCTVLPDDCSTKETVTLVNGRAEIEGSLSDLDSDYATVCGQSNGRDAVYAIPLSVTSDIVIDSAGSDARVVLAVTGNCDSNQFDLGCAGPISTGNPRSRLMLHKIAPPVGGTLFLLVDGLNGGETGSYKVSIEVTPAKSDSCMGGGFDLGACGTLIGFVSDFIGQQRGPCQSGGDQALPEGLLLAQTPEDGTLEVSVTSNDFAPVLYARSMCSSTDKDFQIGCDTPDGNGGPFGQSGRAQLGLEADGGSRLFLFVDGASAGDRYTLRCVP